MGRFLRPGDLLVVNETRVIPARLFARKLPGGGKVELLLLRRVDALTWEALVGGKGLGPGRRLEVEGEIQAEVTAALDGARRLVRFEQPVEPSCERPVTCRCRPTSTRRCRTPSATRRSTPASRARPPRPPPGCTSPRA